MASTDTVSNAEKYSGWYVPDLTSVSDHTRMMLEDYSKVEPEKVVDHVNNIRARAFEIAPYPCVGSYRFLDPKLRLFPIYPKILDCLKSSSSALYLDIGCCFGHDLRQLVIDGVPSSQLIGVDIESPLMELGYDLFRDRETLQSRFVVADILAEPTAGDLWTELARDGVDIVNCSALFHLFPRPQQVITAVNVTKLVKVGGLVVGRQTANLNSGEVERKMFGSNAFSHNIESWRELWEEAGAKTGTKWKVDASLSELYPKIRALERKDSRMLQFTVERIE